MYLFELHIVPRTQRQTRFGKNRFYDPSKKYKESLIWQMRSFAPQEPLEGPIYLDVMFHMPIPKSASLCRKRAMASGAITPYVKPDVDNLAYVVTNAMKMMFYRDDAQIVDLCVHKRYHEVPKIIIKIMTLEELCH